MGIRYQVFAGGRGLPGADGEVENLDVYFALGELDNGIFAGRQLFLGPDFIEAVAELALEKIDVLPLFVDQILDHRVGGDVLDNTNSGLGVGGEPDDAELLGFGELEVELLFGVGDDVGGTDAVHLESASAVQE